VDCPSKIGRIQMYTLKIAGLEMWEQYFPFEDTKDERNDFAFRP
jgi:hypothetical protein